MSERVEAMFGEGGAIARALREAFEPRPEQAEMAAAVAGALDLGETLLVEAGTGVGKSFAYLLPAIDRILSSGETGGARERVVVATNTIALQEQIVEKDLPVLAGVFAGEDETAPFRAELVKGRGNYLSVRRLELASRRQDRLFTDEAGRRSLHVIEDWAYATEDGTLSTLPALERAGVWDRVQSDSGNCMGRKCPTHDRCFYQVARQRAQRADLLICNHALFFSDLALRARGVGFLPAYDHVVLDEAHMVEEVASEHFGVSLSEGRVLHLVRTLFDVRRGKGYLATLIGPEAAAVDRAMRAVIAAGEAGGLFFDSAAGLVGDRAGTARLTEDHALDAGIVEAFRALALALRRLKDLDVRDEDRFELNAYAERAGAIADEAEALIERSLEGFVYWVEVGVMSGGGRRVTVACSPVEVGPVLEEYLFGAVRGGVVLTSATLAMGHGEGTEGRRDGGTEGGEEEGSRARDGFGHLRGRLGCAGARGVLLGSPFDHSGLVEVVVDSSMPDPRNSGYEEALARRIVEQVAETSGGAFVLFTSFRAMHDVADRIAGELGDLGLPMLTQGRDGSRASMLERFRADERSVLLGTSSFWQGVDVRGRGLRNVIITRLPFEPPDRPLTQARLERIEARGGKPFFEDSLPRAVIRFKQGFGRLVRSATDSGRVVVLDPRIVQKSYGRLFLGALPEGVVVREAQRDRGTEAQRGEASELWEWGA
jgi:ATP-dependent DNA helicase DinG